MMGSGVTTQKNAPERPWRSALSLPGPQPGLLIQRGPKPLRRWTRPKDMAARIGIKKTDIYRLLERGAIPERLTKYSTRGLLNIHKAAVPLILEALYGKIARPPSSAAETPAAVITPETGSRLRNQPPRPEAGLSGCGDDSQNWAKPVGPASESAGNALSAVTTLAKWCKPDAPAATSLAALVSAVTTPSFGPDPMGQPARAIAGQNLGGLNQP
jgi:hypothetical protein